MRWLALGAVWLLPWAAAAWGWGSHRLENVGWEDAGSMGFAHIPGALAAWGFFDADRYLDAFVTSADRLAVRVHTWDPAQSVFRATPDQVFSLPDDLRVVNVVPADFDYDGHVDVLVMAAPVAPTPTTAPLTLLLWTSRKGYAGAPTVLPGAAHGQPLAVDAAGALQVDLLGHAASQPAMLSVWRNKMAASGTFSLEVPQVFSDTLLPACTLAHPHTSAHVDLNGDCLADLFLVCATPDPAVRTYQIWLARKAGPLQYTLARTGTLPRGAGALSFADMNHDGTIDVVFSTCARGQCALHVAYNAQMSLCAPKSFFGRTAQQGACRDAQQLCVADDSFQFNFTLADDNPLVASYDVAALTGDAQLLESDTLSPLHSPVPVRLGDVNLDGYPDLLLITVPRGARVGETRVHLLASVACAPRTHVPGCGTHARTFARVPHTVLDAFHWVRGASFLDVGETGALDVVLQSLAGAQVRTQLARDVHFVRNHVLHDAYFLKAYTLNGVCRGRCSATDAMQAGVLPWGAAVGGTSYKFVVLDVNGAPRAQQVAQQPQTTYGALQPPAAFAGLGRTNNYLEALFVGSTRRQPQPYVVLEGVVPNSELVVTPWQDGDQPTTWHRALYLDPTSSLTFVIGVGPVVLCTALMAGFAGLVLFFHCRERREDARERQRAAHAINFDAL